VRVLFCGSRNWTDYWSILAVMAELPEGTVIIHGAAPGADMLAERAAKELRFGWTPFPADWKTHGRRAGPIRNAEMLLYGRPELVHAFRSLGASSGTDDMIRQARAAGVPVEVHHPGTHT
jgi:hypothetical protein